MKIIKLSDSEIKSLVEKTFRNKKSKQKMVDFIVENYQWSRWKKDAEGLFGYIQINVLFMVEKNYPLLTVPSGDYMKKLVTKKLIRLIKKLSNENTFVAPIRLK